MRFPALVGPSYTSQSPMAAVGRLVNLYVERVEDPRAKVQAALYPTPGVNVFAEPSEGAPGRGLFAQDGRCFAVCGHKLYELASNGDETDRGDVVADDFPATLQSNGDGGEELFITSGGLGYILDLGTNVLTQVNVAGPTPLVGDMGGYLDGFFLALERASSTWRISGSFDGSTDWEVLQAQQRSQAADRLQALLVSHKEIWLFGSQTTEVWYNAGASPFPFQPIPNAFLDYGIVAPFSATPLGRGPAWLGSSPAGHGIVLQANGYNPVRISNHAVEYAIQRYATIDDAIGWTYQEHGHEFYVLSFPTAGHTWVYDTSIGPEEGWHERMKWNTRTASEEAWRPQFHCLAFGKHLVQDRQTGVIYEMSSEFGSDVDGDEIRRIRRCPHITNEKKALFFHELELDLEAGLGLQSGQGSEPTVMLRMSRDGGKTWGNERTVSAGRVGQYGARAVWQRLGMARDAVFEISVSDPIPWRFVDAYIELEAGLH
jgi:hypothetical protein